ncbi:MAG: hypothetical protein P1P85_04375 [Patescibacteria group bacterium]|nr:hypothetical protein [Patescibacteria group bacterium]
MMKFSEKITTDIEEILETGKISPKLMDKIGEKTIMLLLLNSILKN